MDYFALSNIYCIHDPKSKLLFYGGILKPHCTEMFAATYFIIYYIQFLQQHPLKIIQFLTKIFVVVIIYV